MWSYLVCATPRSGSTLLCELLKDTGVAGRPEEYFEARSDTGLPPHPGDYLENLPRTGAGIRDDTTPPRAPDAFLAARARELPRASGPQLRARDHRQRRVRREADVAQPARSAAARRRAARILELRSVRTARAPVPQSPVRLGDAERQGPPGGQPVARPANPKAGASSTPAMAHSRSSCTTGSRASITSFARCRPTTRAGRSSSTGIGSRRCASPMRTSSSPIPRARCAPVLDHIGVQPPAGWRPQGQAEAPGGRGFR